MAVAVTRTLASAEKAPASETWLPMGRIVHKADIERLLTARSSRRSTHFALHHLDGAPAVRLGPQAEPESEKLSTAPAPSCPQAVDDLPHRAPDRVWFGCVVPKRHARRAVTRSLLKRQVRGAFERHQSSLTAGLWLVRLRAPFAAAEFISASSQALAQAARSELDGLLARATV